MPLSKNSPLKIFAAARKGEANLIWYIFYLAAAVLLLGTITFLGVNVFSVHTTTNELNKELIYEHTFNAVLAADPITGTRTNAHHDISSRLADLHQDGYAAKVVRGNTTYYTNKDAYDIMIEGIGVRTDYRRKLITTPQGILDVSVVVTK